MTTQEAQGIWAEMREYWDLLNHEPHALHRLAHRIFNEPLMIQREKLDAILAGLGSRSVAPMSHARPGGRLWLGDWASRIRCVHRWWLQPAALPEMPREDGQAGVP